MGAENPKEKPDEWYVWNFDDNWVWTGDPAVDGPKYRKWGMNKVTGKVATDGRWHVNPGGTQNANLNRLIGMKDQGIDVGGWFYYTGKNNKGLIDRIGDALEMYKQAGFDSMIPTIDIEIEADKTGPRVLTKFFDDYEQAFPGLPVGADSWAKPYSGHLPICQVIADRLGGDRNERDFISPMTYHPGAYPVYARNYIKTSFGQWTKLGVKKERLIFSQRAFLGNGGWPTPQTMDASRQTVAELGVPGGMWWYAEGLIKWAWKWGIKPETITNWKPYGELITGAAQGMMGLTAEAERPAMKASSRIRHYMQVAQAYWLQAKAGELRQSRKD